MGVLSRRSPEREQARIERHAAVRARIIDATTDLISEGSNYAALSVETIAARTGISRTTFYDYFPDKRELLLAMSGDILEDAIAEVDDWPIPDDHEQTRGEIRAMFVGLVEAYRHPVVRAIVEATFYDDEVRAAWRANMERHIERSTRLLELEREAGRFREAGSTLEARARALHWSIHATILQEIVLNDAVPPDDLVDAMVDVCLVGSRGVLR
jgi:TetR/AcrR family transcriptional regulator, ethionamide resistance regulator